MKEYNREEMRNKKVHGIVIRNPLLVDLLCHILETQQLEDELWHKKQRLKNDTLSLKLLAALEKDEK